MRWPALTACLPMAGQRLTGSLGQLQRARLEQGRLEQGKLEQGKLGRVQPQGGGRR